MSQRVQKIEIEELLRLKGWSKRKLAAELDLGENIIHRWLAGDRTPSGPASILMKIWLQQAREDEARRRPDLVEKAPA